MNDIEAIARAVLYEGYLLWPYRRSALKNQRRWTFGAVLPRAWHGAHTDDACSMCTECLVELPATSGSAPTATVSLRFLQVVERRVTQLLGGEICFVDALDIDDVRYVVWEEAVERVVALEPLRLDGTHESQCDINIAEGDAIEWLPDNRGVRRGALVRQWRGLEGVLSAHAERISPRAARLSVTVSNSTPWRGQDREDALRSSCLSTHFALRAESAAFISQTDPPTDLREAANACNNDGCWPVLVGQPGDRSLVLAAPIILSDYPRIAPESPGDLFDGGEIDELLTLNILGLTDQEHREMRETDSRTREILDRTMSLTRDEMLRLHGAFRDV